MEEVCNVLIAIARSRDVDVVKSYSDLYQEVGRSKYSQSTNQN